MMAEVDAGLSPGEACEARIDASPLPGTVLVYGRTVRQLVTDSEEMPRFILRIEGVLQQDVPVYEAWLDHVRAVGTGPDLSIVSVVRRAEPAPVVTHSLDAHTRSTAPSRTLHSSYPVTPAPPSSTLPAEPVQTGARERLRQALVGFRKQNPILDQE